MKLFKVTLSLIICFILLFGVVINSNYPGILKGLTFSAGAYTISGTCGENATWEYDESTRTLTIGGSGDIGDYEGGANIYDYNYYNYNYTEISSADYSIECFDMENRVVKIDRIIISEGITRIGNFAFQGFLELAEVEISSTVTEINPTAFTNCPELKKITVSKDNPKYCSSNNCIIDKERSSLAIGCVGSVIPDDGSVTSIDKYAFFRCIGLRELFIPATITCIAGGSFVGCVPWLSDCYSITVSDDNPVYHSSGNCIIDTANKTVVVGFPSSTIPSDGSVTSIGEFAFYENYIMGEKLRIPSCVTSIQDYAFYKSNPSIVYIPESVTYIGYGALYNYAFQTVVFYEGSENEWNAILNNGFHGDYDFYSPKVIFNYSTEEIEDPLSVLRYETYSFYDYESETQNNYASITGCDRNIVGSLSIPSEINGYPVKTIENEAFAECYGLTGINLPESITRIGDLAFGSCVGLESFYIPENVCCIGSRAFNNCIGLESITVSPDNPYYYSSGNCLIKTACKTIIAACYNPIIPDDGSVEYIGSYAFSSCVYIFFLTVPSSIKGIGKNAFAFGVAGRLSRSCLVCFDGTVDRWDGMMSSSDYEYYPRLFCLADNPDHVHEYLPYGVKAPTCTEEGFEFYVCSCGDHSNRVVPALGHNTVYDEVLPATCTEQGTVYESCLRCTYSGYIETPANGHSFGEWIVREDGSSYHICSICGAAEDKTYDVVYMVDGEEYDRRNYAKGETIVAPAAPKKEGCYFTGWVYTDENGAPYNETTVSVFNLLANATYKKAEYVESAAADKNTAVKGEYITWTVITSKDVEYIKLTGRYTVDGVNKSTSVMYRNTTVSNNVKFTEDENTRTWVITQKANYTGDVDAVSQNYTVYYKVIGQSAYNAYNAEPIAINVYATKEAIPAAEAYTEPFSVVSITAPDSATEGQYGTITIVTTDDCDKVRIGYDNGGKMKYATYQTTTKNNVSYSDADGLRTWTINYKFASGATQYTVQGRGPLWNTENGKTFTVTVA